MRAVSGYSAGLADLQRAPRRLDRYFRWRGKDVTRMEAFADSVFALVLALTFLQEVPRSYVEIKAAFWGLLPFGITFLTLVMIWVEHYRFFRRYGLRDLTTFNCNLLLLFLIMAFAFPLKFLFTALLVMWVGPIGGLTSEELFRGSEQGDAYFILIFYSAGFGAIFAILCVLYRHALRCAKELGLDEIERHATATSIFNSLVYVGFAALSIVLVVITGSAPAAGLVYAGLGPVMFLLHFRRDRSHRRLVSARGLDT